VAGRSPGYEAEPALEAEAVFERILLSVDEWPDSQRALHATRDLAHLHGSEVLVVHGRGSGVLAPVVPGAPLPARQLSVATEDEAWLLLGAAVAELRESGLSRVRGQLLPRRGRLCEQILEAARIARSGLIVVGARRTARIWQLLDGRPAWQLIRTADRPILLVR
jgi:nucleotide-binding universal stress UspA family protein